MNDELLAGIERVAEWLRDADRVVALTGAGVSAESGIPTFRGEQGLWRRVDPMQMATPQAFRANPRNVWAWYRWRQMLVRRCAPNAGHLALVELEARTPHFLLSTQNVDGFHAIAGSTNVVELHGNLYADRCTSCGAKDPAWERAASLQVDPDDPSSDPPLPACPECGGLTRPGVVWFGEALPPGAMERSTEAAAACDVLLVVGTSGVVYPAAGLASIAKRGGGKVVVINIASTDHESVADAFLRGPSAQVLPALLESMAAV